MRILNAPSHTLTALVGFTLLAGCGSSSQMTPTSPAQSDAESQSFQRRGLQNARFDGFHSMHRGVVFGQRAVGRSFIDPHAVGKPLVFTGIDEGIDIYLQGGKNKMVGQITGPPGTGSGGLATDAAGDLYSMNQNASSTTVTVYAPPYTNGPKLTITIGRLDPVIAVSRQGTLAVTACTIPSGSQCDEGVVFYAAGSATPCATVLDGSAFPTGAWGLAFDRNGNLYAADGGSATEAPLTVGKIDGGCNAKTIRTFTTVNSLGEAGDIHVDKAGRLAIITTVGTYPYTSCIISTYDPPKKDSLGNPVSTTSLPGNSSGAFAFQASGRNLWTSYYTVGSPYPTGVYQFAYPTGGAPEKTIVTSVGSPYGVAVTPALVP
ncbi:MAG: hypothetical protein WA742_12770 [Candidatus Cybelea sp.]|jgi:hypothetical protein